MLRWSVKMNDRITMQLYKNILVWWGHQPCPKKCLLIFVSLVDTDNAHTASKTIFFSHFSNHYPCNLATKIITSKSLQTSQNITEGTQKTYFGGFSTVMYFLNSSSSLWMPSREFGKFRSFSVLIVLLIHSSRVVVRAS